MQRLQANCGAIFLLLHVDTTELDFCPSHCFLRSDAAIYKVPSVSVDMKLQFGFYILIDARPMY
jgi:hypothetical protein